MINQSLLLAGDDQYQIARSLRFNSADSAYLNRTPASAGNRKTWTWSGWVKRGALGGSYRLFSAWSANTDNGWCTLAFTTSNTIETQVWTGAVATSAVFRDPSAWYHIVLAIDTTQATAANRVKLYVNNVSQTLSTSAGSGISAFALNLDTAVDNNVAHGIGALTASPIGDYYNGYLTEINFIDGQALTPSSFGETDAATGVWKPKKYTGTYGTNGFYLNFSDNSGTTATTLGKDSSGNGNNWTPNNFSVTAGAGNDSLTDTPTAYGTDTGTGGEVRGNYCTLNPLDTKATATLTNGNLDFSISTVNGVRIATTGVSSGKWYWEFTNTDTKTYPVTGVADQTCSTWTGGGGFFYTGAASAEKADYSGTRTYYGTSYGNGDVIGVALDMDAGTLVFYKNGVSQGTAFNTNITGKTLFPAASQSNASAMTGTFNFGQRPFAYTAPSGYKALCTQNLPTPTIGATSSTQANKYFDAVLYTGNGTAIASGGKTISGISFQPDFVWIKSRTEGATKYTGYHNLYDSVRGANKYLTSSTTEAESTLTEGLTSFNSNGFTLGNAASSNYNGDNYVGWQWNAGGSNATNTAGSITSTVRANASAGFSIVTYTGTKTSAGSDTVGHGLGVAPSMIIVKRRNAAYDWPVGMSVLGWNSTDLLMLNTTGAKGAVGWNDFGAAPTSTVFTVSYSNRTNIDTGTFVAYCFAPVAGYSAFGSYTGNGSTDGVFVYTGFRPAFVMTKCSSTTGDWRMYDLQRPGYNVIGGTLLADTSGAETTSAEIDFLSNGFKLRTTTDPNSAQTFVYAAFAATPFRYSLAR